jgi:hypothetical protein
MHVRTSQDELARVGDRHECCALADPHALELAVEAQSLIAVARGSRLREHRVGLVVAVERQAQLEQAEVEAVRVGIVGMPAGEPRVRLGRDPEMLAGSLEARPHADRGELPGKCGRR